MKKIIILYFLSMFCLCGHSQLKTLEIPLYASKDTSFWFKLTQDKIKQSGLKDLTRSTELLHFRFSTETQFIDLWTSDYKLFEGSLTNYTTSVNQNNNNLPIKFSKIVALDTANARKIYSIFFENAIFNIPTDKNITGWEDGFDGVQYCIEYSTPQKYSFKEYWNPESYIEEINEAQLIFELANQLASLLKLEANFYKFLSTLPKGCYEYNGASKSCNYNLNKD